MLDIENIFKHRVLNTEKLAAYGFEHGKTVYFAFFTIMNGQFKMKISIQSSTLPEVKVFDNSDGEEYVLIHTPKANGGFVGSVIQSCEERLKQIADACYDYKIFKSKQAEEIIAYVMSEYNNQPEFLWTKFPENAVLRRADTGKWYAALLVMPKERLGQTGKEKIEIIDLREKPDKLAGLIDSSKYFPGYHMNKKHWYTVRLDGSVETEEICRRIDASYELATK